MVAPVEKWQWHYYFNNSRLPMNKLNLQVLEVLEHVGRTKGHDATHKKTNEEGVDAVTAVAPIAPIPCARATLF